jgi:hypothetical protein
MSNWGMGLMGPMGLIGLMGKNPVMENHPAQRDSKISILKTSPLCPYCPLAFKNRCAQRDSGMSKLGLFLIINYPEAIIEI